MLLERFGLWQARNERAGTFSRGMQQRLALCRVAPARPDLLLLDEPFNALDAEGAELLDAELAERRRRTASSRPTTPRLSAARRDRPARTRMSAYFRDVAALARKDLLLELRARETLPAMLLFVVSALTRLPLRAPGRLLGARRDRPPLDRDRLHGAPRPHARVRRRARAGRRSTGSSSRRATAARSGSASRSPCSRSSSSPSSSRFRRSRSSSTVSWELVAAVALADIGICAVGTLLAAMAAAGRARELLLPLLFLPLAIPVVVGGVGASVAAIPASSSAFSRCTTPFLRFSAWATFEYVVTE